MYLKPLFLLAIFALLYTSMRGEDIIVTSNADSGPGTLREAITKANSNGTTSTDNINFNIADVSISGRTIMLETSLPLLTSNIIIDGSTQPGSKIGVSDAKIRLTNTTTSSNIHGFHIINASNIEIYGIHFDNLGTSSLIGGVALEISNAENIITGAPGKGNYFSRLISAVTGGTFFINYLSRGTCVGFTFKSNIVNLTEDGNDVSYTQMYPLMLHNFFNVQIGGDTDAEGNFIACRTENSVYIEIDTLANINSGYTKIKNNKLGCNYQQTTTLQSGAVYLRNITGYGYNDTCRIEFANNTYNSMYGTFSYFLRVENRKGFVDVKGNKAGLLMSNPIFSSNSNGIALYNCENGIIGGPGPGDANILSGSYGSGISVNDNKIVTITKNSLYCNSIGIRASSSLVQVPKTKILAATSTTVSGTTSLPHCLVEVFSTKTCLGCHNGETYLGSTISDVNGNWAFTGTIDLSTVITATATTQQGVTGEFAKPEFSEAQVLEQFPTCSTNIGFIKGLKFISGTNYYWIKNYTDTVFRQEDLTDLGPGLYEFVAEQTSGCRVSKRVSLYDMSPKVVAATPLIVNATCGLSNGRIGNLLITGLHNKVYWKDEAGNVVANSQFGSINLAPGKYKMVVLDTINNCGDSTQWITVANLSGASLELGTMQINPASCESTNGSIIGITAVSVNGTSTMIWVDSLDRHVGNTLDLMNVKAGKYRLKFKDQGNCDTIITPWYTITSVGFISIDTTKLAVTASQCAASNGTIGGLTVTGATTFQWTTESGTVVSNELDVNGVLPGKYKLTVTNSFGCLKATNFIAVPVNPNMTFTTPLQTAIEPGKCGQSNGFIRLLNFPDPTQHTFKWIDSTQPAITRSTNINLDNINQGTYILFAKNASGCEQQVFKAKVVSRPGPVINQSSARVTDEVCSSGTGRIEGIFIESNSGTQPMNYSWRNEQNQQIGSGNNLQQLSAGTYRLTVTDAEGCTAISQPFSVNNRTVSPSLPKYADQSIRTQTSATLSVQNPEQGVYQLFDSPGSSTPVEENITGVFNTPLLTSDRTYYVRLKIGSCVSNMTAVKVFVYNKSGIYVPTAFTPNNDGKNDLLKVIVHGSIKLEYFKVFNRWGQLVFSTSDVNQGWNGSMRVEQQQTSTFVWMLRAKDELTGEVFERKGTVIIVK